MNRRFEPLVVCYHAVSDVWPHALAVRPGALERQLRSLLLRRYRAVGAADVLAGRGRLLHVTFDDAFRSVRLIEPLLDRLAIPATVFACAGYADGGRIFAVPELAADAEAYGEELATMTWDELRDLSARGTEVGSHTVTHPHLLQLDDAELRRELRQSRERIEEELGRACRYLSYPYGESDGRVRAAARDAGYEAAFGLPGGDRPAEPLALPRVGIWRNEGLARVLLKTSFARPSSPTVQRIRALAGH
jgi:peptidoglycan/xylan/chitin deacetylase (PgdA/CDA1 family)